MPTSEYMHRKEIPCPVPGPGVWKAIPSEPLLKLVSYINNKNPGVCC